MVFGNDDSARARPHSGLKLKKQYVNEKSRLGGQCWSPLLAMMILTNKMNLQCQLLIWVNEPPGHEKLQPAVLEIPASIHCPFCLNMVDFSACVPRAAPALQKDWSKYFHFDEFAHLLKSTIDIAGSFYLLISSLQWGVDGAQIVWINWNFWTEPPILGR